MSTEVIDQSKATAPTDDSGEMLTDHTYDGIQEYDNPLPGWWKFLFWVSILFSPVYYFYFHVGAPGRSIEEQYNTHMASMYNLRFSEIGDLKPDRDTLLQYMNEPDWLAVGEVVYKTNCVSCHGAKGEGLVGPNLTDSHWKNVRKIEDIVTVINEGAANGSMPAWKNRISHPNQRILAAAYIASLNKNPLPGPREAEGIELGPWEEIGLPEGEGE